MKSKNDQKGGQQTQSPAQVEGPETDCAAALPFFDQQGGDEEAAQDKRHINPERASRQRAQFKASTIAGWPPPRSPSSQRQLDQTELRSIRHHHFLRSSPTRDNSMESVS